MTLVLIFIGGVILFYFGKNILKDLWDIGEEIDIESAKKRLGHDVAVMVIAIAALLFVFINIG